MLSFFFPNFPFPRLPLLPLPSMWPQCLAFLPIQWRTLAWYRPRMVFPSLGKNDRAYATFIAMFRGATGPISEIEYVAFLLVCLFIFCSLTIGIVSAYLRLAQAIVKGRKFAFVSFVLSYLYRSIQEFLISSKPMFNGGSLLDALRYGFWPTSQSSAPTPPFPFINLSYFWPSSRS